MSFPNLVAKNQFGEQSNLVLLGGSLLFGCNMVVDSTNGNGLGYRNLKGAGIAKAYMHTSATPAAGNPNPEAGLVWVQLAQAYSGYITGFGGTVSQLSGTPINITSGVVQGLPYVIVSLGTTTAAQWQAIGLPVGVVPAVGVSFVASVTGNGVGTGVVEAPASGGAGVAYFDVIGDPNLSANPSVGGAWILTRCMSGGSIATPADGSVIGLNFSMNIAPQSLI